MAPGGPAASPTAPHLHGLLPSAAVKDPKRFRRLVLAGGGCRCFWQLGFWQALREAGLEPAVEEIAGTSAGAAMAVAIAADRVEETVDRFERRTAANPRNVYPLRALRGERAFPHHEMYRGVLMEVLGRGGLERVQGGPEVRIQTARLPRWLGPKRAFLTGAAIYQIERRIHEPVHPVALRAIGYRAHVSRAADCRSAEELADLVLAASAVPPLTPVGLVDGARVLDGGLVGSVPVGALSEPDTEPGDTLVLLSRRYPNHPVDGRTYVEPSEDSPVSVWDYANPAGVRGVFELGRRDARSWLKQRR